jgi:anti-sigma factor RsiW
MKKSDKRILHRALDGEVSRSETRFLHQKLQTDGQVRTEFEELKKVVKDSEVVRMEVPPDFTRNVLKGVEETTRRLRRH